MLLKRKKVIFNIHLILSLICFIPMFIIAMTGVYISYDDFLGDIVNKNDKKIANIDGKSPLELGEIIENFYKKEKDYKLKYIRIFKDPHLAYIFSGYDNDVHKPYFINQYSGEINGDNNGLKIYGLMRSLHGTMGLSLISENKTFMLIGRLVVGIANLFLFILLISGVWLYFPRIKKSFFKSFLVRLKAKKYALFYELHSVLGLWSFLFLLSITSTGIYYSYGSISYIINLNKNDIKTINTNNTKEYLSKAKINSLMNIIDKESNKDYNILQITFPNSNPKTYYIYYKNKENKKYSALKIDANTMSISSHEKASNASSISVFDFHNGEIFGNFGIAIFAIASFLCGVFIITGFIMTLYRLKKIG